MFYFICQSDAYALHLLRGENKKWCAEKVLLFGKKGRLFLAREMDWDNTIQFAIISGFLFFQYYNRAAKKSLLYVTV